MAVLEQVLTERGYEPFEAKMVSSGCGTARLTAWPTPHRQTVCGMNLALLEQAAASPNNTLRPVLDPRPGLCCVVLIRNEEPGTCKRATQLTRHRAGG